MLLYERKEMYDRKSYLIARALMSGESYLCKQFHEWISLACCKCDSISMFPCNLIRNVLRRDFLFYASLCVCLFTHKLLYNP